MKALTIHQLVLPLAAGILFTLCSPSWGGGVIFSENFNGYTEGNQNALQVDTGLLLSYGGNLPGWQKAGGGAIHAVDMTSMGDYAAMIWQDNVITLTDGIAANEVGTAYSVAFLAGPTVYNNRSQATADSDGIVIDVLRADNSVLISHKHTPGAWEGTGALTPASFWYVGDGSGPVLLRVGPLVASGRFAGAIDDLTVSDLGPATPPTITTQPVGGTVIAGSYFTFSVVATGAMTYQWRKNGTAISGATTDSYQINDVKTNDAGTYSVLVANPGGSVPSADAILNVTPAPSFATFREAVLADKPIHYYPLDETNGTVAADLGSLATTGGTYTGGFTLGQSAVVPGCGTCVRFDGKPGTYVDLGLFHPGDSITAEVWVNLDSTAQRDPSFYDIVGRIAGGGPQGSWILGFASGYLLNMAVVNDSGVMVQPTAASPMTRDQWHHIVGTFDAVTHTANVYVDGVRGSEQILGGVLQDRGPTPDRVLIGASRDGTNSSFNWQGFIDEVAIYDTALSAAQVRAHYRASIPAPPSLNIQRAVIVSWPIFPPGYMLQSATNVTGPYEIYPGSIHLQGDNAIAPVPLGPTQIFFRLFKP